LVVCQILQWFENLLPVENFVRVHRSHLVNRAFITERPAETYLLLQNGETIPVSRRRRGLVNYSFFNSIVIPS
jgi:two-component system LytT family response regulator